MQALLRIAFEAAMKQAQHGAGRIRRQSLPVRIGLEHRGERVAHPLAGKKTHAGEHFEPHYAEGPDVGAPVQRLARAWSGGMYAVVPRIKPASVA